MRLSPLVLLALALLAGCETYTDRTSPCFTSGGHPAVGQAERRPADLATSAEPCVFVPLEAPR